MSDASEFELLALRSGDQWRTRAETAEAQCKRLKDLLGRVRMQCLFEDDDGQIGISEDVVIPTDMFEEICCAVLSDTAQQEEVRPHCTWPLCDGEFEFGSAVEMRERAAKHARDWIELRFSELSGDEIQNSIRALPIDPETGDVNE